MDNKKKYILIVMIVIIIAVFIGAVAYKYIKNRNIGNKGFYGRGQDTNAQLGEYEKIDKSGNKINTSSKLKSEKEYNGLKVSNINLQSNNGATVLLADVENTSSNSIEDFTTIDIRFVDKNGEELGVLTGLIKPLKANEKTQLNSSTTSNLTNAYDFEITEHEEEE